MVLMLNNFELISQAFYSHILSSKTVIVLKFSFIISSLFSYVEKQKTEKKKEEVRMVSDKSQKETELYATPFLLVLLSDTKESGNNVRTSNSSFWWQSDNTKKVISDWINRCYTVHNCYKYLGFCLDILISINFPIENIRNTCEFTISSQSGSIES